MMTASPCDSLPLELAERLLAVAINALPRRPGHRGPLAFSPTPDSWTNPLHTLLCVFGPRRNCPDVTAAALARCWWVDLDFVSGVVGDAELLQILEKLAGPVMSSGLSHRRPLQWTSAAMDQASKRGFVEVLDWWYARFGAACWYTEEALTGAAEAGHLDILNWWMDHKPQLPNKFTYKILLRATRGGHANICMWWLDNHLDEAEVDFDYHLSPLGVLIHALMHAVSANDPDLVMLHWWLAQARCPVDKAQLGSPHFTYMLALRDLFWKHRSTSALVLERGPSVLHQVELLQPLQSVASMAAAAVPGTRTMAWLCGELPGLLDAPMSVYVVASASSNVDLLDWLSEHDDLANSSDLKMLETIASIGLMYGSSNGHIRVLDWWIHSCPWFHKVREVMEGSNAVQEACAEGHVHVLEWWEKESKLPYSYNVYTMQVAAKGGHVKVLDWLVRMGKAAVQWPQDVIRVASENNRVNVLDWWLNQQQPQAGLADGCGPSSVGAEEIRGTMAAITAASGTGNIDALDWWAKTPWFVDWHKQSAAMFSLNLPQPQTFDWWIQYLSTDKIKFNIAEYQAFHDRLFLALSHSSCTILLDEYVRRFGVPGHVAKTKPGEPHAADHVTMRALQTGYVCMYDWWMRSRLPLPDPAILELHSRQTGQHFMQWLAIQQYGGSQQH